MAENTELGVLTRGGLQKFAEELLTTVNTRIGERITPTIDADSDEKHMPSAAAVYTALNGISSYMPLVIESGNPADANITPNSKTVYVVRNKATDTLASAFIYLDNIGYVKFAQTTTTESSETDLQVISDDDIVAAVNDAAAATAPTL